MERKRVKGRFVAESKQDKGGVVSRQITAPAAHPHQAVPQSPAIQGSPRSLVASLLDKWKQARSGGTRSAATSTSAAD
jgi:hypothetical protein